MGTCFPAEVCLNKFEGLGVGVITDVKTSDEVAAVTWVF